MFVDKGETSWSREIKEKSFHEELCSSDRSEQPDITPSVIRAQTNLSGEIRVEQTHDRSGQPDKHKIERQDAPEVHREVTMLNTDNELTRERIEEDIDFNIPGQPHSTVKQLHSASVRELIQKIENHPNRHALQLVNAPSAWRKTIVRGIESLGYRRSCYDPCIFCLMDESGPQGHILIEVDDLVRRERCSR